MRTASNHFIAVSIGALGILATTGMFAAALAQGANLSGWYRCLSGCTAAHSGGIARITQNGWDLNLLNTAGTPSKGWVDWPGHIWVDDWNEGAVVSPDGRIIQFDRGTIWRRM